MIVSNTENCKYNSYYLHFWIGDDDAIDAFCEKIKNEPNILNHYKITENWIRNRLENDDVFFKSAVEEVSGELNYILECIHENAAELSDAEWQKSYGNWTHIRTTEQVADEYYGEDGLLLLIPEWYAWVHEDLED